MDTAASQLHTGLATRVIAWLHSDVRLAQLSIGAVALHVADDNFLQPNPGASAADHLVSGLVPLGMLVAAGIFYGRLRAGARAVIALLAGVFGVLAGIEAVHYMRAVGPSGDDYTGLLSLLSGLVLIGVGVLTLWRSRRRDDRLWWRYGRRALLAFGAAVVACVRRDPARDLLRRHARLPRDRARRRSRGALREGGVHHGRRAAARGAGTSVRGTARR